MGSIRLVGRFCRGGVQRSDAAMILYIPAALFVASLLTAYGSAGRSRQAATVGTVVAAGWALALLVDPGAAAWAIGPIGAALLLARKGKRVNSSFEGLTRLGLAAVAVVAGGIGPSIARIVLFDVSVDVSGVILLASAVLLVAGAALTPIGSEWTALLGVLAMSASAPSLRWAALGALIAVATVLAKEGEHLAWIAFGILGLTPVLQGVATSTSTSTARVQAVAPGLGLVLMGLAPRAGVIRVLVLPATGFLLVPALATVTSPNLVRLQWIAR